METSSFSYDAKSQVVKLSFPEQLTAGPGKAVLNITFSGIMNNEVSQAMQFAIQSFPLT